MTKILLVNGKELQAKEEKETIFELIQNNKQFIFITEQKTMVYEFADKKDDINYSEIAVNINHIVEVF